MSVRGMLKRETFREKNLRLTSLDLSTGNLVGRCRATASCCELKRHSNHDLAICDLAS